MEFGHHRITQTWKLRLHYHQYTAISKWLILRVNIWVFPKIVGFPPKHPFVHRVFHDFHHPFWVFLSLFLVQHPYHTPIPLASYMGQLLTLCRSTDVDGFPHPVHGVTPPRPSLGEKAMKDAVLRTLSLKIARAHVDKTGQITWIHFLWFIYK